MTSLHFIFDNIYNVVYFFDKGFTEINKFNLF